MADLSLRILRQDGPKPLDHTRRWESFSVRRRSGMTIADALRALDAPVAWDDACEWPACGVCSMVIQGRARAACATSVDAVDPKEKGVVTLAPLAGFALIRDLWVDKSRMASDAARIITWPARAASEQPADDRLSFTRCTRCGACVDACPESRDGGVFVGPAAFAERHALRLRHPDEPLGEALRAPGGIADCGHAEACVAACPEGVPLDRAIGRAARDAAPGWLRNLLR